jgi:hypothetical protein
VLGLEAELNEVEMDMQIELTDPCSPHDVLRQFSRVGREAWLVHVVPRILAEFRPITGIASIGCQDNGVLNPRYSALVRAGLSKFEKDARSERGCRESVEFILSESEYGVHVMAWRKTL